MQKKNEVKCTPRYEHNSSSAFNCLCAGGTSDYPYKSGYVNGKGQYPEINASSTTPADAVNRSYYEINVKPDKSYRLRVINSGFNFGLRFSIDGHNFDLIGADGSYANPVTNLSHVASMPGERYDIIFNSKNETELAQLGGRQFFVRATTYNATFWGFNTNENSYELLDQGIKHTIFAVLMNYEEGTKKDQWFAEGAKLARALSLPAPELTKVVEHVSQYYSDEEYFGEFGVSSENVIKKLTDFRYPGAVLNCTEPVINGKKGPVGAPFGCFLNGTARPIPRPDLLVHLFVNGIMYPAYNLFMSRSPVLDYDESTASAEVFNATISQLGVPNMFARTTIPLVYSRGKYGTRNLDVWGASPDSPGYNVSANPPRGHWGNNTKFNIGNKDGNGVTNFTEMIYLPKVSRR
jgi:hypothetical protein